MTINEYSKENETMVKELIDKLRMYYDDNWHIRNILNILDDIPQMKKMLDFLNKNKQITKYDIIGKAADIASEYNHVAESGFEFKKTE